MISVLEDCANEYNPHLVMKLPFQQFDTTYSF